MSNLRNRARAAYADAIAAQGPKWANCANSIRTGFENLWITPALDALENALRHVGEEAVDAIDRIAQQDFGDEEVEAPPRYAKAMPERAP